MRYYSLLIFSFTLLIGCSATHTGIRSVDPFVRLKNNINSILSDSLFSSTHASIKVVSLHDHKIFYERDSKKLMHPASNMKLLTSAAALAILDTTYRFRTSVFLREIPDNGVVIGDVYLKGYGDPDLRSSDLDSLAVKMQQYGIMKIYGNIIVDDFYFDDLYWGAGWTWDDESDPDAPYINALSVNKNCISITLLSDSTTVYPYLEPMTDFVTVINKVKLCDDSVRNPLKIKRLYLNNPNTIVAGGDLPFFNQYKQKLALRSPEYYTGTLFKESLQHAGIIIQGEIVSGKTPDNVVEIAYHEQPIEKMIINMNKISDNLSAENTLKVMGARIYGIPGSSKNGTYALNRYLMMLGLDTTKMSIVDGSGVSRYNLLTAEQLVTFLTIVAQDHKIFPVFYNSLPIAGVDGTLSNRMTTYPAACKVHAKTGTLNGASCLSGYAETQDGEILVFSMMMQNFNTSVTDYRNAQDRICSLLAGFSRKRLGQ